MEKTQTTIYVPVKLDNGPSDFFTMEGKALLVIAKGYAKDGNADLAKVYIKRAQKNLHMLKTLNNRAA
jgi:hypothetical protein